ncbi:scramblase [Corynebacterium suranareeae]|uniref:Scramblase n=1 Tax=Corynebacterium suranareeae TaxID=2506452 RepID=A0A169S8Q7_9CORY|nr:LURP-one-related family protein [Corynebacterium suranareeae]BAU97291.1 scramblase [Corynebacterium suranareeae]
MNPFLNDTLIVQQITSFLSNDFEIYNPEGDVVIRIKTEGSLGSRLVKGDRRFTLEDAFGTPLMQVRDPMNFVRDTYEIDDANGTPIAHVRKRFTFFNKRMDIELPGGSVIEMHGNFLGFDFEFRMGDRIPAHVSRKWSGAAKGFLGRSTYAVNFDAEAPEDIRKVIIGAMIALDLIRAKEQN